MKLQPDNLNSLTKDEQAAYHKIMAFAQQYEDYVDCLNQSYEGKLNPQEVYQELSN